MEITNIKLLIDFGLVVLIWMVQLVIYPSFLHYRAKDLIRWHQTYTKRISLVVAPLMIGQAVLALFQSYQVFGTMEVFQLAIIIAVWISTFAQFVPIHHKIASGRVEPQMLHRLVNSNWLRTVLWNGLFVLDLCMV
ncbi:MAG: hypothetical protein E4H26_06920 [Flavobacteriales bacterium]|nr:MAG: hypothetical protein E4H26_06920 [Flavobacteriales bacterium]